MPPHPRGNEGLIACDEEDYQQTLRACLALSESQVSHHEQMQKIILENSVEAEEYVITKLEPLSYKPINGISATLQYMRSTISCASQ